ncbi:hypothetical protein ANOBCDAF_04352 [Pleomorphomonas sp. T1.2MG-36]|uniref:ABC transporter permease n=1 Tax=Pleomorphomonas sp. T1.2MG-36 TaxID=3041167 RepID=UPI002477B727|nr:hypothetical protein [Pleomorphomonas sp. T1.2MG-36]CAI9418731.1 hypothetical protein ANOBCDAF_04352 [Pleomorphomonas sp. T1.2MG-36]
MRPSTIIERHALAALARERTIIMIALLFAALVLASAYLGWSATITVDGIYASARGWFASNGQPIPPNPVTQGSALELLRNLTIYISLIGVFSAIVFGYRMVEADRRAGVLPLIGTRPLDRLDYARGKIGALAKGLGGQIGLAALVGALTLLVLPSIHVSVAEWVRFAAFFGLGWFYMMTFGLVAIGSSARAQSETAGLLVPAVLWLTLTFVMPALTGNILPTAAINPVSALAPAPQTLVFDWCATLLGPISLAEAYKYLGAELLGYLPVGLPPRGAVPPLVVVILAGAAAFAFALNSCLKLDMTKGGPNA